MAKIELTKDELQLIKDCIYQSVCHADDLLADFRESHNMTQDELDNLTILLRQKLDCLIKREYYIY